MLKNYTTIGLRMSRYGAAEVFIDFAEELKHTEANPMCSMHVTQTFETRIHRLESIYPGDPHQRNPNAPKFEGDVPAKQRGKWQDVS